MRILARILLLLAAFSAVPLQAQQAARVVVVEEWVEDAGAARFVSGPAAKAEREAIAAYGPFRVLDARRAALVGGTDSAGPAQFSAMLGDFPGLATLEMLECPGTMDDAANLRLGRMIRAAGLATSVPDGGSVRSGGVELFLAGSRREVADGAEFAVHAWEDEDGMQAGDYAAGAPENRRYLAYYREMGMSAGQAQAFYAMTNSAPYESALWLTGAEMRRWAAAGRPGEGPRLVYLDLGPALN
jgi:hypothetical protein